LQSLPTWLGEELAGQGLALQRDWMRKLRGMRQAGNKSEGRLEEAVSAAEQDSSRVTKRGRHLEIKEGVLVFLID